MWQISRNKITFSNSYKEKISIVFGILQMYLGIFISLLNNMYVRIFNAAYIDFSIIGGITLSIFYNYLTFITFESCYIFFCRHFKNRLNILCEFLPQVLFLTSIFGYLVVLIFVKWIIYTPSESACAPSLLIGN